MDFIEMIMIVIFNQVSKRLESIFKIEGKVKSTAYKMQCT